MDNKEDERLKNLMMFHFYGTDDELAEAAPFMVIIVIVIFIIVIIALIVNSCNS